MDYRIDALPSQIHLGKQGDNNWLQIRLDVSAWKTLYPAGVCTLLYERPDGECYPVTLAASGSIVTWTVSSTDTAVSGTGKAELRLTENSLIRKAAQMNTVILPSLVQGDTPTAPDSGWLTTLEGYAVRAEDACDDAETAAATAVSAVTVHNAASAAHSSLFAAKQDSISDLSVIRDGAAAGASAYQKPAAGIPKTDLASAVQTSLGKADTALQAHQSLAAYRTAAAQNSIDQGKVDKVAGKGLSANDYTNADKAKVAAALTQHQSLTAYRTAAAQDIIDNGKQPTISDLSTIRSGAALGATALQSVPDTYRTAAAQDILDAGKLSLASQALTDAQKAQVWSNQTMVKTAMDAVAVAGAQYYLGVQSAVSITLPATALAGQEIVVVFYSGSTAATLTVSGTVIGDTPTPAANQRIELNYLWDGVAWCLVSKVDAYEAVSE